VWKRITSITKCFLLEYFVFVLSSTNEYYYSTILQNCQAIF